MFAVVKLCGTNDYFPCEINRIGWKNGVPFLDHDETKTLEIRHTGDPDSCVKAIGDMLRAKTVDTTKPAPRPIDATFTPDRLRKEVPRQTPEINESSSDDEKESDLSMDEKLLDDTSKAKSPSSLLCRRCISDDDDEEEAPKTADPREKPRPSKKYFCIFCKKLQTHLSRHLTNMHSDKEEVREFSKRAPGTEIRLKLINKIRGQGAIEYNSMTTEAVREESGSSVQIGRRPKGTLSDVEHYLPCLECGNYYKKRNMRDHYKKCAGKAGPINLLTKCRVRKLGGMIPPSYKVTMSEELKEVLGGMGATPIIMKLVERDPAIVAFGNKLCKTNKHILSTQVHFIRRHLKVMAVITTRMYDRDENDPDRQLSVAYYYRHEKFDLFKSAVTDYMVYEDGTYKSPSQASAIGRIWLNCAKCLSDLYLDLGMKDDRTNLEEWLQKYKSQYYVELEKPATAHQTRSQWGKKMTIPNDEEVAALCSHLRTVMRRHKKQLKIAFDYTHWAQLSKALLVYTTVSNYKRAAEVQGARLSQYRARETYENFASNWSERLTPEDIEQCKLHTRFLVKGKRSKGVSVLMRTEEVESMELLLAHRQNAEVSEDNDFLFAKAHTHFNCQSALREFAKACKVERHHLLTTTKLRKHFASSVTVLNLPGNEMTSVAQFLGHDEKTEARYYRMPDAIEEMARLSTLLYASTTMAIPKLRDRTLRTINQEESALDTAAANASSQNECPAEPISKGASEYLRRLCAINSSHSDEDEDEDEDDEEEVVPTTRTGADVNELGKGENRLERSIDPFQEPQPSTSSTYVSPTGVVRDYFPVATYYSSSDDDQNFITRRKTKPKCLFFTPSPEQRHQAVSPPSTRVSRLTLTPETTSSTYVPSENDGSDSATTTSAIANKTTNTPQKRNVQKRLPWTPRQTKVIEDNFKSYLDQKKAPSTKLIEKVISKNKRILKSRTVANIRTHIHNMNTGKTNRSKKVRRLDL